MKKVYNIVLLIITSFIFITDLVMAGHWDIEGWNWIDNKDEIVLWQKKDNTFISEALINVVVPIGCEILRGYTVKLNKEITLSDYQCNKYPVGIWKVIYNGLDSSGNIYLKIMREKENINDDDINKIKTKIKRVSDFTGTEEDLIEKRQELFSSLLENYLEKEADLITVDSSKIVILNGLNYIPPFIIQINEKHTAVNISVENLK